MPIELHLADQYKHVQVSPPFYRALCLQTPVLWSINRAAEKMHSHLTFAVTSNTAMPQQAAVRHSSLQIALY